MNAIFMPVIALASGRVWQGMPAADRELIQKTVKAALDEQIDALAGNEPRLVEQFKAAGANFKLANPKEAEAVVAEFDKIWLPKAPVLAELRKAGQSITA
jgi:TRAP-type C4-dicarboxylate transport system substrate-binding protein